MTAFIYAGCLLPDPLKLRQYLRYDMAKGVQRLKQKYLQDVGRRNIIQLGRVVH